LRERETGCKFAAAVQPETGLRKKIWGTQNHHSGHFVEIEKTVYNLQKNGKESWVK
jgi:hypothetical protein